MKLEKRIWNIASLFTLLLVLLSTRIVYWQLWRGDQLRPVVLDPAEAARIYGSLQQRENLGNPDVIDVLRGSGPANFEELPQPVIQRTQAVLQTITRGSIYDRNGRLLAYDKTLEDGRKVRLYTEPSLAHVIGYVSGLRTGITGLEHSYNNILLGLDRPDVQIGQLLHQPIVGSDLILTIDSRVQRAADEALAGRAGSITVLDASSGAVLAMASAPRFDPNRMLEADYVSNLLQTCETDPSCQGLFLNRATQALYPPGSTWKTVTLIAALDTGQVNPQTVFDFGKPVQGPNGPYYVYRVGGGVIPDPNHRESRLALPLAYAKSANAAFARVGDEMSPETFVSYANRLGFSAPDSQAFPLEIPYSPSQLATDTAALYDNDLLRAATAIGQGELLVNPLNMGMVTLSVMNGGSLPLPYFVQTLRSPSGGESQPPNRRGEQNLYKAETANEVKDMMVTVVKSGSGARAALKGATVGGKTGTAQLGGNQAPHAWFMGFAQQGDRAVVIVVAIENGGEGSQTAAPIFSQIADVALNHIGEPVPEIVPEAPPAAAPEEAAEPAPSALQLTPDLTFVQARIGDRVVGQGICRGTYEGPQGTGSFIWPADIHQISGTEFRIRHPGIDLGTPVGAPVFAADTGVVVFAGWTDMGWGNTVIIDHQDGFQTLYGHLSQVGTACGAQVSQGEAIGLSGKTGNVSGPHLHFEIRVPDGFIDPLKLLPPP